MATRRRRELADYGRSNVGNEADDISIFITDSTSESDDVEVLESDADYAQTEVSVFARSAYAWSYSCIFLSKSMLFFYAGILL